ncbi:hypothetical protein [Marinicella sp. W31]|uniref:hypothetical protein n=1 Tax=Marinicella sp. W31 TaxID=3023713 RepID=UPI003757AB9B
MNKKYNVVVANTYTTKNKEGESVEKQRYYNVGVAFETEKCIKIITAEGVSITGEILLFEEKEKES